ncbi:MAG: hypothetical protein L6Q38_11055 [Nitrospira sp.]|nr:hypothetical protein [Nitrospira sp.]
MRGFSAKEFAIERLDEDIKRKIQLMKRHRLHDLTDLPLRIEGKEVREMEQSRLSIFIRP